MLPLLLLFLQVTARVSNPPPLKLQSFDGLVDHSCMEDQEKKGGILSKVTDNQQQSGCSLPHLDPPYGVENMPKLLAFDARTFLGPPRPTLSFVAMIYLARAIGKARRGISSPITAIRGREHVT